MSTYKELFFILNKLLSTVNTGYRVSSVQQ